MLDAKKKITKRKAQVHKSYCVACGTCLNVCPMEAIKINSGVFAEINMDQCVGCGKCEKVCPASTIEIILKEEVK